MTKTEQLEYMRKRFPQMDEISDAVIPVSKQDILETVAELDSFREFQRDRQTSMEGLNSDEG